MKTKTSGTVVLLCLLLAGPLSADTTSSDAPKLSPSEIETLTASIALYPDALMGIILPAAANSTDIVLAARYLEKGGAIDQADKQPWDESVRSLAHYPEVLKWMDENLEWTQQLGVTFLAQPEEVMAAIQRLRARALALGNLPSTEQLTVLNENNYIRIVPTVPDTIYAPYYDPDVIYVSRFHWGFGPAWLCGPWLTFDCNWISRAIWIGVWNPVHFHRPPWFSGPRLSLPPGYLHRHTWRPDPGRISSRPKPPPPRPGHIVRPRPMGETHFNRPGQPPPSSHQPQRPPRHQPQRPGNLTEQRHSSGKQGAPPALRPDDRRRPTPPANARPAQRPPRNPDARDRAPSTEQRQPRDVSRSRRVDAPAGQPPSSDNASAAQKPSAPPPRQQSQSAQQSEPASSPPPSRTTTRDTSDARASSNSSSTSNSNDNSHRRSNGNRH